MPNLYPLNLVLGSAGGVDPLVRDIGFCLILAGTLCVLSARLRVPSIAAFLAAGIIVGPQLGTLVTDPRNIETIANLGLTLLLFVIGLEINIRKLFASGKTLLVAGGLQVPLCVALGIGVTYLFHLLGWEAAGRPYLPLYVGFTIALSSTLLVVQLFQEKFQLDTVVGRISLGILIFQDVWAIVILAAQPNFSKPELGPVGGTFLGIVLLAGFSVIAARYALPAAFRWIAKAPELMLVAAMGWCFGVGTLGQNLGGIIGLAGIHMPVQVSMEMGALIAGISIASLPYSHEVVAKVAVVRDFFVTLFFVGLGMGIPRPEGIDVILLALFLAAAMVLARGVVFFPLLYFTGLDRRSSVVASTKLSQISEFCLVIAYLGMGFGHLDSRTASAVIFAFVLTALTTPFLFRSGDRLHDRIAGILTRLGFKAPASEKPEEGAETYDIILLGFHRAASSLFFEIERAQPELIKRMLVVDFNVGLHEGIQRAGAKVVYGDISDLEALVHLGVDRGRVVCCTVPDDVMKGITNVRLAAFLRHINPQAMIIVNAVDLPSARKMYEAGADFVFLPRIDAARNLLCALFAGLRGDLKSYRAEQEACHGRLEERREILP